MNISLLLRTFVLSLLLLSWINTGLLAADMSRLIETGCTRCHKKVLQKLEQVGSAHTSATECRDCHLTHPKQRGAEYQVAECTTCHDPQHNKHFTVGKCGECHHAHWPLEIDFAKFEKPVKQVCISCHGNPFQSGSQAHAEKLGCTQCHASHGSSPSCLDCHDGHTGGKAKEPCLSCHAAHNPLPTLAAKDLTAKLCKSCHAKTSAALAADKGAHAQLACDECHARHKDSPDCMQCHEKHSEKMSGSDCGSCHSHHIPMPPAFTAETNGAFCVDCHAEVAAAFGESGGAHQENLSCVECHENHPPAELRIAACSSCHDPQEKQHFALEGCNHCHNAHKPNNMNLDLSAVGNVLAACESCHADVIETMAQKPTAHSEDLSCNLCHRIHGQSPSCLECHEGHGGEMEAGDCSQCHIPHSPAPVAFGDAVKAEFCAGCHAQVVENFNRAGKSHQAEFTCTGCHQQHPPADQVNPACRDCHAADDNPHFASQGCSNCHDPHQPIKNEIFESRGSRQVCAGCHQQVEEQLTSHPSAHDRDCVACHRSHIGDPSCLGCHLGHGEEMTRDDCLTCHQPHAPLMIDFGAEANSQLCAACHDELTGVVEEFGGAHRDQLNCSSCHQGHPDAACTDCHSEHPQKEQIVPKSCFVCHAPSDHLHFTVGDCEDCHVPHQPLEIDLKTRKPLAPVCVSCHLQVKEQFTAMPGGHSEQDCINCHSEHKKKRICVDCHDAHTSSMSKTDCATCHSPHQPQDIRLQSGVSIPVSFCASCHEEQATAFLEKGVAHQKEFSSCTACHPEHGPNGKQLVTECGSCHAKARRRHFTLEGCAGCHDPHQPLVIDLSKQEIVKPVCISCHSNQERLFKQNPNKHLEMDCIKCHPGDHGSKLGCLECHESHLPKLKQSDCLKCHPPHLPQLIKDKPTQAGAVCVSCHQEPGGKIKEQGASHKNLQCISCHWSHPPAEKNVIISCKRCHEADDHSHFAVSNCQECHLGHQPLQEDLSKAENVTAACVACHAGVAETFAGAPSKHAEQTCNSCHPQHKLVQGCLDCHQPHSPEMVQADCLSCHESHHAPAQVVFTGTLPAGFCQSCHQAQVDALAASQAAHNQLACLDCHQGNHGNYLACSSCHEQPHDPGLHSKFPDCLKCHLNPHDLADWRGDGASAETAPEEQAEETDGNPAAADAASSEGVK